MFVLNSQSLERTLSYRFCGFIGGRNEGKRSREYTGFQRLLSMVWYGIVSEKSI